MFFITFIFLAQELLMYILPKRSVTELGNLVLIPTGFRRQKKLIKSRF